jgi:hypothetical protein
MFLYEFCSYYCIVLWLIREAVGGQGLGIISRLFLKRIEGNQNSSGLENKDRECPKIPYGFSCYVCGSTFETNQERLMHLEKFDHLDLYNTVGKRRSTDFPLKMIRQ